MQLGVPLTDNPQVTVPLKSVTADRYVKRAKLCLAGLAGSWCTGGGGRVTQGCTQEVYTEGYQPRHVPHHVPTCPYLPVPTSLAPTSLVPTSGVWSLESGVWNPELQKVCKGV